TSTPASATFRSASSRARTGGVTVPGPTSEVFAGALVSADPHPDLAPEDRLFDPFIGSWDLEVTWYEGGRVTRTEPGEWHFAWVLEGRAVQDVWIVPRRDRRGAGADLYEYGTSLRFPDPDLGGWRSTWLGPMHRVARVFTARREGDDVVLDTTLED